MDRRVAISKSRETKQLPPWASQDVTVSSRIKEDRNEPIGVTLGKCVPEREPFVANHHHALFKLQIRGHLDSTGSLFWRFAVAASARELRFHLPQVQRSPATWVLVDVVCRDVYVP